MIENWNLSADELRHLVMIEEVASVTTDTRGTKVRTWQVAVGDVFAKIETPVGRKMEIARQLVPTATHVITMRYRKLSVNNNRINFCGRIFNIGFQNNVQERGVKLELTCTELVGDS